MDINIEEFIKMMQSVNELQRTDLLNKIGKKHYLPTRKEFLEAFESTPSELLEYCSLRNIYEIWTKEYIEQMVRYISRRKRDKKLTVVEIGAGDGKLSHFLRKTWKKEAIDLIATDTGEWDIPSEFVVEKIGVVEAIEKYNPDIIICSWMVPGINLSISFDNVQEYILIGDPTVCGLRTTWEENNRYEKVVLKSMKELQICHSDILTSNFNKSKSTTVSFRRRCNKLL